MFAGEGCSVDGSDGRWEALREAILWQIGSDGHCMSGDTTVFSKLLALLCDNPQCIVNCGKKCKENVFVSHPFLTLVDNVFLPGVVLYCWHYVPAPIASIVHVSPPVVMHGVLVYSCCCCCYYVA